MYIDKHLTIDLAWINSLRNTDEKKNVSKKKSFANFNYEGAIASSYDPTRINAEIDWYTNSLENQTVFVFNDKFPFSVEKAKVKYTETLTVFEPFDTNCSVPKNVLVNQYVFDSYRSLRKQLFDRVEGKGINELFITGFGLGGAIASLFIYDLGLSKTYLPVTSILFGIPKVGNFGFSHAFNHSMQQILNPMIRVSNQNDWLTHIPLDEEGYRHIGKELEFRFHESVKVKKKMDEFSFSHNMENYYRAIAKYFYIFDFQYLGLTGNDDIEVFADIKYYGKQQIKLQLRSIYGYCA